MQKCENCGNVYAKSFQVIMDGTEHSFDSFECAINALAPHCAHCDTRIIGHGVEQGDNMFCCARCAQAAGVHGLHDHVEA
ncbi:MAG TPA: hypothetical protein PKC28_00655 [Bdellovibrionales bacterium]|nr:hypothetical protein [Bdellovibrionales bacterium]